jgi:hypothetical protein
MKFLSVYEEVLQYCRLRTHKHTRPPVHCIIICIICLLFRHYSITIATKQQQQKQRKKDAAVT